MNHTQLTREVFHFNKLFIQKVLGWNEEQYQVHLFERAYSYLEESMKMDEEWISAMTKVEGFWLFWQHQWNIRNAQLFIPNQTAQNAAQLYERVHSHQFIATHPSRETFDEAYAVMVGETFGQMKTITI